MAELEEEKKVHKIIITGDCAVGKTCLLMSNNPESIPLQYTPDYIDIANRVYAVKNNDNTKVTLQCWNIGVGETFRSIQYTYYANCKGCLVVFDVTREETLHHIIYWITKISNYSDSKPIIYLIGTKIVLQDERQVSYERAQSIADNMGLRYIEVSSYHQYNVESFFPTVIAQELLISS